MLGETMREGGPIVAGPLVRLACERHLRDRESKKWIFDYDRADFVIAFFETVLRLPDTGDGTGQPRRFLLEPAQAFIVGSLFGWTDGQGIRRFREAYIEAGKGSGKTPLLAGIGLYGLTMDGERAAEIYAAAVTRDQAAIMFRDAARMVDASPDLSARLRKTGDQHVTNISDPGTLSLFRPFSRDQGIHSGPRPHMGLIDELHEHPSPEVVNKMRAGAKFRKQPLFIEITNSGFDRTSICWDHHEHARKVLEGTLEDDKLFAFVCGLDPARTEVFHGVDAAHTMVNLCTCESAPTMQNVRQRRVAFAADAISNGTEPRARTDAQSTQDDPSDRRTSALSVTTESGDETPSTDARSASDKSDGTRRTATASLATKRTGSQHALDIAAEKQRTRNSEPLGSQPSDSTNSLQSREANAQSAARNPSASLSITTTKRDGSEGYSVESATAGSGSSGILSKAYNAHSPTCRVRQLGKIRDSALIVEHPADDPLEDPSCWIKTNPLLGVTVTHEYLERQVQNAKNLPSEKNMVLRLNFCQWTQSEVALIDLKKWRACGRFEERELAGALCYGGLDLGYRGDFSSFARIWLLPDGRVAVKIRRWLPQGAIDRIAERDQWRRDLYLRWAGAGLVTVTDGDATDLPRVGAEIEEICRSSNVLSVGYDPKYAEEMRIRLEGQGVTMVSQTQGFQLNEPVVKLQELIAEGKLCHNDGDECLSWMAGNAVGHYGREGDVRLAKDLAKDKIDDISAIVNALKIAFADAGQHTPGQVQFLFE